MLSTFLALALLGHGLVLAKQLACNGKIPIPEYFGTKVTSLEGEEVTDWNQWTPWAEFMQLKFTRRSLSFCNVTLTYTHPGQGDHVHVYLWLPLNDWNGNFLAMGGGGFAAGGPDNLAPAVACNYAAVMTDAGHSFYGDFLDVTATARTWALTSPGNINWQLLQNFASISLDDMTHLGKRVVESFYGLAPKFSYWNGCSTGGRQGLMQAQRYPKKYDGVLATAPAINWATFLPVEQWPQVLMARNKYWPPGCEVEAITAAAIEACDELDGVKDGIIAAPDLCKFDAESIVGNPFDCDCEPRKISAAAARIVNGAWEGVTRNGNLEWFGLNRDARLGSTRGDFGLAGLAQTSCDDGNKKCKGQEYTSVIDTADPDLSEFRAAGGKMITWHGLTDQLIFPNGSSTYYERVLEGDPGAAKFYRYFEAPGAAHCGTGPGAYPGSAFDSLVDWVENGKAPEHLDASTMPVDGGAAKTRPLCLYPSVAAYQGGDPDLASSFKCATTFGSKKASDYIQHSEI